MRLPDLDLDLLRGFVTVAERGGFTAAGQALGLTQSAVSLKVKRLEDVLGKPVLLRQPKGVALTREGETLLAYARRMLALNEEAVRRFDVDGPEDAEMLIEAFDGQDALLGTVLVSLPVIAACKPLP